MIRLKRRRQHNRTGVIYILALMLLTIFVILAASLSASATLDLRSGDNQRKAVNARLVAESGVAFMIEQVKDIRLPGDTTFATLPTQLAIAMGNQLNGTANLGGYNVSLVDGEVLIPPISVDTGVFTAKFMPVGSDRCRLEVTGRSGEIFRRVSIDMVLQARNSRVFDYGVASKGAVSVLGSAVVHGLDDPTEASVISTTSDAVKITVDGSASVSGDLFTPAGRDSVYVGSSATIAGTSNWWEIENHIHTSVTPPDFPATDSAPLAALATTTLDPTTDLNSQNLVLNNIRIPAGMNPNFSKDVVINGVVVVEAPNHVKFDGKATVNGMIVTEPSSHPIDDCIVRFAGQVEAYSVETLPDTEEFAEVKQQTGTFILAPGFDVRFAGQFNAINGTIAADKLTFSGTAEGIVNGAVIGMKDYPTEVNGNVDIYVDRATQDHNPAGFLKSLALEPEAISYTEHIGQ